jgi:hypothetical protein
MTITGGHIWTVGGMRKNLPLKQLQLLQVVLADWGLVLWWRICVSIPYKNMPGLLVFIALFKCSRFSPYQLELTMMSLSNESISRGPQQSKNNISITLLVLSMLWFFFSLRDDGCFHCWLMCLVSGSQCKLQNSSPTTIQSKNSSPSLSYRSRCSKQLLMWVAFCLTIQQFGTHTAETFQHPRTYMMMWSTCSTLICWSITWQSHCTIWSTMAHVSGSVMCSGWLGHVTPSVFLTSLNVLHQSNAAVCWTQSLLYSCFICQWMSAGFTPSAHRN